MDVLSCRWPQLRRVEPAWCLRRLPASEPCRAGAADAAGPCLQAEVVGAASLHASPSSAPGGSGSVVAVLGAAGGIGQPLSLLLKL